MQIENIVFHLLNRLNMLVSLTLNRFVSFTGTTSRISKNEKNNYHKCVELKKKIKKF